MFDLDLEWTMGKGDRERQEDFISTVPSHPTPLLPYECHSPPLGTNLFPFPAIHCCKITKRIQSTRLQKLPEIMLFDHPSQSSPEKDCCQ